MAPSTIQHRRTHNLLLISKLLNQRDAASPFTLILDTLEQSGKPLVAEYIKRANSAKVQVIFVSSETLKKPKTVDVFIEAWKSDSTDWQTTTAQSLKADHTKRKLLVFDSLNTLSSTSPSILASTLSSFISPTTSLLAVYYMDIPSTSNSSSNPYSPYPLTLLKYLATTIFTTHSLHHILARKMARDRSLPEPVFGLEQSIEGVLQSLGANATEGVVLEMQHRRRSGRGVGEWFYLPLPQSPSISTSLDALTTTSRPGGVAGGKETVILLEDHPLYRSVPERTTEDESTETTFELGLTEKQRRDRENVVLPYFDAQKGEGAGEGGRILYDMGSEDDFDEEEDEI